MVPLIRVAALILILGTSAFARGGGGGYVTTFDPNWEGGGWACFRSLASGTCGGATAQYFNAACDGTTDDSAALAAWIVYGHGLGARAKLYIPPGSNCTFPCCGNSSFFADITISDVDNGIPVGVVWAYGAKVNRGMIGGLGYYSDNTHNALIQAANAGDPTVTLITAGDATIFSVGRWIAVTGFAIQTFGQPVDHAFFEYKLITAISSGTPKVITLDSPLKYSYKTTWPQLDTGSGGQPNQGGPAMVYLMQPTWNTNATIFGLEIGGLQQVNVSGRNIEAHDIFFNAGGGLNPTGSQNLTFFGSKSFAVEIDKNVSSLTFYRGSVVKNNSVGNLTGQSMNDELLIEGMTIEGALAGNSKNTTVRNTKLAAIKAGPIGDGHGNNLVLDGVTFTDALANLHIALISSFSFSSGILTISKASGGYDASVRVFVPGYKYFMGSSGFNLCTPPVAFTVTDIVDAGANVNIVTDLVSIPVANICNGFPPDTFNAYQAMSLTQKFSGPGDLLSTGMMVPP